MNYLAMLFPFLRGRRLWLSRDQAMLLMAAFNLIMLGLDTYLAHVLNNTILWREWIPILFGPIAGAILLLAGLIARRQRALANWLATAVFIASIIVGILGTYFHLIRGSLPSAPIGQQFSIALMIWAPPLFAPFAFAGIGVLGISAAWRETPVGSGRLELAGERRHLNMPYSKTRAYMFLTSLGILMALVSSVLDHARHWGNPWFWLPLAVGVFATAVAFGAGAIPGKYTIGRTDVAIYFTAMVLMTIVGVMGLYFHVRADLTASSIIVPERFLRGAPFMSPLLYANMGIIGILALLDPQED